MIRGHYRLLMPALLAASIFFLNNSRAQDSTPAAPPAPASKTVSPAAAPPLTPEVMDKMLKLIAAHGTNRETAEALAGALGLADPGKSWPNRQMEIEDAKYHYSHGFAVSRGSDQDILLSRRTKDSIYAFRAHRDGKVVKALIANFKTGKITMRDPAEAQADFGAECSLWAANADHLLPAGK